MLEYIKNECKKNNIKFEDKEYISTTDLNVYNNTIKERNDSIDEKLKGSIWTRKNSAVSSMINISLECNCCYQITDIFYGRLMTKKIRKCKVCTYAKKEKELQEIINYRNWKIIGKYTGYNNSIAIQCTKCNFIHKCVPAYVHRNGTIQKCLNC
jgi:hypothetical protein